MIERLPTHILILDDGGYTIADPEKVVAKINEIIDELNKRK